MRAIRAAVSIAVLLLGCDAISAERDIRALVQGLHDVGKADRIAALRALEGLGLDAVDAVPQIALALESRDTEVQVCAVRALAAMRKDAAPAIPKLIVLLRDNDEPWVATDFVTARLGSDAADALAAIGADAVGPLVGCLADPNRVVRFHACSALGEIGPEAKLAVTPLLRLLRDAESVVRLAATDAVARVAPNSAEVAQAVIERLNDEDRSVRVAAVDALKDLQPVRIAAIDALNRALDDKEGMVQAHAANALGDFGKAAVPAIPALAKMLKSRNGYPYPDGHPYCMRPVGETAARALGRLGGLARTAMPSLLDVVRNTEGTFDGLFASDDDNRRVRAESAKSAVRIDPGSQELLRVLADSLRQDPKIRDDVALACALAGAQAKPVLPILRDLLRGEQDRGIPFACAILSIEPANPDAIQAIVRELETQPIIEDDGWAALTSVLAREKPARARAIPALTRFLSGDGDPIHAARALAALGPTASSAIDPLAKVLEIPDDGIHREVVAAIWRIAPRPADWFATTMKVRNAEIQRRIVKAMKGLPGAEPLLIESLDSPSANVRFAAIVALDSSHLNARALQSLKRLQEDRSRTIRDAAAGSLRQRAQRTPLEQDRRQDSAETAPDG
jgi:HEAT repeat protein